MKNTRTSLKQALQRGQAMSEYGVITAAFFGFTVLSWPFLIQLMRALNTYFQSIYYIIQSPIP
ncbi:hypothetical protein COCOR_01104 [Corallococcus coralloides DSM 2259]|uniref:Uncharacterized protein n=1 Tax=Corallococcus coralloides (strain ATCC 25202 / DSM 2259 / NBRC 100086 / M2) TaxID=1144275 RepID=H8MP72_CORCM|nr:hypothetical protein [Corallococcus coralloides]AFE03876.1 hypothetical protein COCOR_01104 [Corallococcus coralloides DSM 2259]